MKPAVLNVNNFHYYRGGSDQYFLKLTMLLKEKGHRVTTFSTENTRNINKSWLAGEMPRSVDTEKFSSISNILRYCYSPEARKKMALALQEFRPDLVHLHIYYGQLTGSIIDPIKNAGIPIIQTLHEYKLVCPTHGLFAHNSFCDKCKGKHYWKAIIQRCNRNSIARTALSVTESYISEWLGVNKHIDRYIAVSQFQKNQLVRLGIEGKKIDVLYHYMDNISADSVYPGDYFLFVGRLVIEKGLEVLLHAFAQLPKPRPQLKIAGDGNARHELIKLARRLDVASEVEWLGFCYGEKLDMFYKNCLAVINPSLLNETFGLTCLEALMRKKPVIASNIGAFPEVVTHGYNGFLFQPGDYLALRDAMQLFSEDRNLASDMGEAGYEKVKEKFSIKRHYEGLMKIYRSIDDMFY